jgi:hypothetical protein
VFVSLVLLAAAQQVLIDTLAQSKVTFNNIERKVKEAAKTQEIIARTRRGYAPVAFRASQLFFCIADLGSVDPMYQVTAYFNALNMTFCVCAICTLLCNRYRLLLITVCVQALIAVTQQVSEFTST